MRTWNVGNTTVRNPSRLKDGLHVLQEEFEGKPWDARAQIRFYQSLVHRGVVSPKDEELPAEQTQGINGRKWAAAFNQLGLAVAWQKLGAVMVTAAGHALLSEAALEEDVFLRQLLKWQLPSPVELRIPADFNVQPFRLVLKVMTELIPLGVNGLTKEEIALYVITTTRNDGWQAAVQAIARYRDERSSVVGSVGRMALYGRHRDAVVESLYSDEFTSLRQSVELLWSRAKRRKAFTHTPDGQTLLNEIAGGGKGPNTKKANDLKQRLVQGLQSGDSLDDLWQAVKASRTMVMGSTLDDYADSMVRYFGLSGLFSLNGDNLILRESKVRLIESIVAEGFSVLKDDDAFRTAFYSAQQPELPIDRAGFLRENIETLQAKLATFEPAGPGRLMATPPKSQNLLALRKQQADLEAKIKEYKEQQFYRRQAEEIDDIINFWTQIESNTLLGGTAYLPAWAEWTTWRGFLAINTLANTPSDSRHFEIDDEINPIHHARAGLPDLHFEYSDFEIVCEVTLAKGPRQWTAEGESVPRHVAQVLEQANKTSGKAVRAIFVAPLIDPDTAHEFLRAEKHIDGKFVPLDILPLTIDQLKSILRTYQQRRFSVEDMRRLLERCFAAKTGARDGVVWLALTTQLIKDFCRDGFQEAS